MNEEDEIKPLEENSSDHLNFSSKCSLQTLVNNAAELIHFQTPAEQIQMEERVDELLIRLEDFCSIVDLIRCDTQHCMSVALPQVTNKARVLETLFFRVDQLEKMVALVRSNVDELEDSMDRAEKEMGTLGSLKKSFLSKIATKSALERRLPQRLIFNPPAIFSADKLLHTSLTGVAVDESVSTSK